MHLTIHSWPKYLFFVGLVIKLFSVRCLILYSQFVVSTRSPIICGMIWAFVSSILLDTCFHGCLRVARYAGLCLECHLWLLIRAGTFTVVLFWQAPLGVCAGNGPAEAELLEATL